MPTWLPSALLGLLFGSAISVINHFVLQKGINKAETALKGKGEQIVMTRFGLATLLNVLALFLVYKNTPMLIGTAMGLMANKYIIFFKHLKLGKVSKKGVK